MRRLLAAIVFALFAVLANPAVGAPKVKVHRVARGNTLGKIAKRYAITVTALCHANDISKKAKIKIGQKLLIPPKGDKGGKKTRKIRDKRKKDAKNGRSKKKRKSSKKAKPLKKGKVKWHKVYKRQNLGSIARRYNTSVAAIVHANDIKKKEPIHPGQMLIIPPREDKDGSRTRKVFDATDGEPPTRVLEPTKSKKGKKGWAKYKKRPKKKGYVHIVGLGGHSFKGYLVNHKRLVTTKAKKAMKKVLATKAGEQHAINLRLLQLIAKVSDTFGGRKIRVVSGYRSGAATSATSRHRHGKAVDFIVTGVPNTAVRDYAKTLKNVGVGYYPNSSFVHLDTRKRWTYWIDYSGPGQRPRYGGFWTKR